MQNIALMEGGALRPVPSGPGAPDTASELIAQTAHTIGLGNWPLPPGGARKQGVSPASCIPRR